MGIQSKAKQKRRQRRERLASQSERRRAEVEALFDEFEALLRRHRIHVPTGSKLEQALLLARQLRYIREEEAPLPDLSPEDEDDMFRRVTWLWGMAPKLVVASRHDDFAELLPHLRLVVEGEFAQSVPGHPDGDSDKLFELVVALAILPEATNLRMDTGNASSANPDLLFDFRGTRWAIACKALYSSKSERYRDSVIKGASQIEKSEAARGVVCVSLRNLIDQSLFLPRRGDMLVGMPFAMARELLAKEEDRIHRELIKPVRHDITTDFATRPKTEKAVLHVSAVCARTGTPEDVRLTYLAHVMTVGMTVGRVDGSLLAALNAGLQASQPPLSM
jgi:hypothetical protein